MRVLFTAQDSQTIRDAFGRAKPNIEYAAFTPRLLRGGRPTRSTTCHLPARRPLCWPGSASCDRRWPRKNADFGHRVQRELEIRNFVPSPILKLLPPRRWRRPIPDAVCATDRIVRREIAQDVVKAADGFEGALAVRVEEKRQGPPKLHDLPSLQKLCGSRFGWSASKTLEVAQELYDGQGKKIITYRAPRCAICRRA